MLYGVQKQIRQSGDMNHHPDSYSPWQRSAVNQCILTPSSSRIDRLVIVLHTTISLLEVLPSQKDDENTPALQKQCPAGHLYFPTEEEWWLPISHFPLKQSHWQSGTWQSQLAMLSSSPVPQEWATPHLHWIHWWNNRGVPSATSRETSCALVTGYFSEQALTLKMCLSGEKRPEIVPFYSFLKPSHLSLLWKGSRGQ